MGRRKTSVAHAQLNSDVGKRTVNGIALDKYFTTIGMQQMAQHPLVVTSQIETFGFSVKVSGGGKQSQAGAVRLALARALLASDNGFHKQLKTAGVLTRDPRAKERKKPGLKRARRAPQFSKR